MTTNQIVLSSGETALVVNTVCMCPACVAARALAAQAVDAAGNAAPANAASPASNVSVSGLSLADQQALTISFENGLAANNRLNWVNYWNWDGSNPPAYDSLGNDGTAFKAGSATIGTGGTLTYYFDPGSNWTASEQTAIRAAMQLWHDEANITFVAVNSAAAADETFYRYGSTTPGNPALSNNAFTDPVTSLGDVNTTHAGTIHPGGYMAIDTSVFGNVDSYTQYGGYGITTLVHELGHAIGLGHTGAYNGNVNAATQQNNIFDTRLYSIMSYIQPNDASAEYFGSYTTYANWGVSADGYARSALTPMMDDVVALQQLYGAPTGGGLQGGQVFGFNCNITDGTGEFFDFTRNALPVVTLYDAGSGNTLDLSGFTGASTVNLNPGSFSSCAGMTDNIGIAYNTAIDTFVGGAGNDTITINLHHDTIDGGGGTNTVVLSGLASQYSLSYGAGGVVTVAGNGQYASLTRIARLTYSDGFSQTLPASGNDVWAGGNGDLMTAGKWIGGVAPGPTGDVSILSAGTAGVAEAVAINSVQLGSAAVLAVTSSLTLANSGGSSVIAGELRVANGGSLIAAGTIEDDGLITLSAGATLRAAAAGLTITGSGTVLTDAAGAAITGAAGAALSLGAGVTLDAAGTIGGGLTRVNNGGTVLAGLGQALTLGTDVTNSGTLQAAANGTLVLNGTVTQGAGGHIVAAGGTVTLDGATVSGGSLGAANAGALLVRGGATLRTATLGGTAGVASGGTLTVSGGALNAAVTVAQGGSMHATGQVGGSGSIDLGGATLALDGGVLGAALTVANGGIVGTGTVSGSLAGLSGIEAGRGQLSLANAARGAVLLDDGATLVLNGGVVSGTAITFLGSGVLNVATGAPLTAVLNDFDANDAIDFAGVVGAQAVTSGGVTRVVSGNTTLATLTMHGAMAGTLAYSAAADGHGGTVLTAAAAPQPMPVVVTTIPTTGVTSAGGSGNSSTSNPSSTSGAGTSSTGIVVSPSVQVQPTDDRGGATAPALPVTVVTGAPSSGSNTTASGGSDGSATHQPSGTGSGSTGSVKLPEVQVMASDDHGGSRLAATVTVAGTLDGITMAVVNGRMTLHGDDGSTGTDLPTGLTAVHFADGTAIIDATGTASDVARLYQATFGRTADADGITYFTQLVNAGTAGLQDVASGFLASSEGAHLATEDTGTFVAEVYGNMLGQSPDADGLAYWSGMVDGGTLSRAAVIASIAGSGQAQVLTMGTDGSNEAAEVNRLYQAVMGHAPDAAGQAYWTNLLHAGLSPSQLASGLLASSEFATANLSTAAFVAQMYEDALGRTPDADGAAWFAAQIDAGAMTRSDAAATFAGSAESQANTAAATHQNWVWLEA